MTVTRITRRSLIGVALVIVAFSAGSGSVEAATVTGKQPRAVLAAKPKPDKPAAPVEIELTSIGTAAKERPIEILVAMRPRVAASSIELRILPSKALSLLGADTQVLAGAAAGQTVKSSFSVVPRSGGTMRVGVLVTLDTAAGRQTRPAMLSLDVKGAVTAVASKPSTRLETTHSGERVVVFQGR